MHNKELTGLRVRQNVFDVGLPDFAEHRFPAVAGVAEAMKKNDGRIMGAGLCIKNNRHWGRACSES